MKVQCAFAVVLSLACGTAAANCASTVVGLRALAGGFYFPLRWIETGMEDGKPLVLGISERAGLLHLQFVKTREGLWAEGPARVCAEDGRLLVRFEPGAVQPGPASTWLLRQSLRAGARFEFEKLAPTELHVSTTGWRGRFAAWREHAAAP
ncbi:hypothetical protein [Ramlibacter sp.]|uniref:hypothetical protein n=1 Tax=Ramlibacter sp. TaxID=1917967 RepID=UPI003D0ADAC7